MNQNMPLLAPFPPIPTHEEEKTGSCEISVSLGTAATMLGLPEFRLPHFLSHESHFIAITTPA